MKDREEYLHEVETRLARMFRASREGHKAAPVERHRLEGFIQAGTFVGLATKEEVKNVMDRVHFDVFGKSIEDRQSDLSKSWTPENIDYSQYELPAYERDSS
jgi:hypothetical protein